MPEPREAIAQAIHDGPSAQAQYAKVGIGRHDWEKCPYQAQYLADADAVLATGLVDGAALAEAQKRLDLVEAVANRGTGHDLNPTVLDGYGPVRTGGWVGYLNELDRTWRDRIRSALNGEDPTALAEAQLAELRTKSDVATTCMICGHGEVHHGRGRFSGWCNRLIGVGGKRVCLCTGFVKETTLP